MDFSEGKEQLRQMCQDKDWFVDVGADQYGRYAVYVRFMNMETMTFIPREIDNKQVMVHFVGSKTVTRDKFVKDATYVPFANIKANVDEVDELVSDVNEEKSLQHLIGELEYLEKQCGSYSLQEIFYEVHDGPNAVTNISVRYQDVRTKMEKLYRQYGFDVIYEEMDG